MPMPSEYKVTRLTVRQALSSLQLPSLPSDAAIDAAIASVDQDAAFDAERTALSVVVWDKTSPINGVPASEVLAKRTDIPQGGAVYLIQRDGHTMIFQPHPPGVSGNAVMSESDALSYGNQHADALAGQAAHQKVLNQILQSLV